MTLTHDHADEWVTTVVATIKDTGLQASVRVAMSSTPHGLPAYLEDLADRFRGWEGARTWESWGRELAASAVFRAGGHVAVTWTLARRFDAEKEWRAEVTTVVEAGAEMSSLTAAAAVFIAGAHQG